MESSNKKRKFLSTKFQRAFSEDHDTNLQGVPLQGGYNKMPQTNHHMQTMEERQSAQVRTSAT